jgi:intein-encoded DNA endonuclease-like protein
MLRTSTDLIRSVGNTILSSKSNTKKLTLKEEEIQEWIRCRSNPLYYIKKYVKFETVGGVSSYAEGENFHPKLKRFVKAIFKYHKATLMASRQLGKALDISTPLLKPTGQWTTMENIKEGDYLYDSNGYPTKVVATTEIMYDRPVYEIEFDNNDIIRCDENHLWKVSNTSLKLEDKILTTKDIFEKTEKLKNWSQSTNFRIKITPVMNRHKNQIYVHPYVLGLWLGDGTSANSNISTSLADYPDVKLLLNNRGYRISDLRLTNKTKNSGTFCIYSDLNKILRKMKILNNKHIPNEYLFSDIEQRLELLRGLLDSDGYCNKKCGMVQFYQKNFELLKQVRQLLSSLGIKSRIKSRIIKEQTYYTLTFTTKKYRVFNLDRKAIRQVNTNSGVRDENYNVFIKTIKKIDSIPVKCIQVDAKDGMFLCGETLIPTHNSSINAGLISWSSVFYPRNTAIILNFKKEAALANLAKIKFINDELPDFLKLETTSKSDIKTYINYSNGSKINVMFPSSVHSKSTIARSLTSPILYIDEAAFISDMSEVFGFEKAQ